MCISSSDWTPRSKRCRVRIHGLNRRKRNEGKMEKEMELTNLKLYMENIIIFEENEKLRKKANLLHQENLNLMFEFQKKFSKFNCISSTLNQPFCHQ